MKISARTIGALGEDTEDVIDEGVLDSARDDYYNQGEKEKFSVTGLLDSIFSYAEKGSKVLSEINKISENKNNRNALELQKTSLNIRENENGFSASGGSYKTLMYVGIGVGGLVLVGGLIWALSSGSKKSEK